MNYSLLKTIIETSISQYTCQNCQWKIDENSINIRKIGDGNVDFHVICPHCQTEAQMHAEIGGAQFNFPGNQWIQPVPVNMKKNIHAIQESDIANIERDLTNKQSIEDLLK